MNKKNPKVRAIFIKVPFWLKWLKRFIKWEIKEYNLPKKLRGRKIDFVIVDEIGDNGMIFRDYKIGVDFAVNGQNSKVIK